MNSITNLMTIPSELLGEILQYVNGEDVITVVQTSRHMKSFIEEAMSIVHLTLRCDKIICSQSVEWFTEHGVVLQLKEGSVHGFWRFERRSDIIWSPKALIGREKFRKALSIRSLNGVPVYPWMMETSNGINFFFRRPTRE
jgi:hypothetical protein